MKRVFAWVGSFLCVSALTACGGQESTELEGATLASAIEVNSDGSGSEAPDAVEGSPLLLPGCGLGLLRDHLLGKFDRDGDGDLSGDELPALRGEFGPAHGAHRADGFGPPPGDGPEAAPERAGPPRPRARWHAVRRLVRLYNVDQQHGLSEREQATLTSDLEARCENRTQLLAAQFDADQSGALDAAEWEAAHAAIRARFEARRAAVLAAFDANQDGTLDDTEREAAHEARHQEREAELASFDSDGDGVLSDEERTALVAHFRAKVRGDGWTLGSHAADQPPAG